MKKFILASASARRKYLLEKIGIPFTSVESNLDEQAEVEIKNSPYEWVKAVAAKKGHAVFEKINVEPDTVIISADTIVTDMGKILHRPKTKDEAREMLASISGRKHTVYTGLTLIFVGADGKIENEENFVDATDVYMHNLTDEEIEAYISTDEPYDKAGGYGIQGKGSLLIEKIYGDYYTVVGLPLAILYRGLKKNGVNILEFWDK